MHVSPPKSAPSGAALEVRGVTYRHRGATRDALDGLDFDARPGTITGLLGPNGAGKTTFVSLLCGIARPQSGELRVFGLAHRSRAARVRIGYCPQELALYTTLTAAENLHFFGRMARIGGAELGRRVDACLEAVRLADVADQRVEEFSGGMQRRLNLATALVHGPRLLVLDEPTVGVDMASRLAIFDTLESLAAGGTAILYTTHYMEEVERLCEDVVVLADGRVIAACTTAELVSSGLGQQTFRLTVPPGSAESLAAELTGRGHGAEAVHGSTVDVVGSNLDALLADLARLVAAGTVLAVDSRRPSLEERFLDLTRDRGEG